MAARTSDSRYPAKHCLGTGVRSDSRYSCGREMSRSTFSVLRSLPLRPGMRTVVFDSHVSHGSVRMFQQARKLWRRLTNSEPLNVLSGELPDRRQTERVSIAATATYLSSD